jgi:hypothetical protein
VEQLQGQERRVIIISTVRSTPAYLSLDVKHKLGFVANARRFNVAITRAQVRIYVWRGVRIREQCVSRACMCMAAPDKRVRLLAGTSFAGFCHTVTVGYHWAQAGHYSASFLRNEVVVPASNA